MHRNARQRAAAQQNPTFRVASRRPSRAFDKLRRKKAQKVNGDHTFRVISELDVFFYVLPLPRMLNGLRVAL